MTVEWKETRAANYELEVPMEASQEDVWKALTEDVDAWWLPDFHMLGEGSVVRFDANAGGQMVETSDRGSLLWFTVLMSTPGQSMDLVGYLSAEFGGPSTTMLNLSLEARGDATTLRVRGSMFGCVSDTSPTSLYDGWKLLFEDGLKAHVEK